MAQKKQRVLQQIEITDYAAEGKSLARVDGKVIFVKGAMPGDIVDIQLTKSKKDWGEGHILRHHQYSSRRVDPFCQHFGLCGGCSWQMVPYEEQLVFKQQQVEDQLKRLGRISLPTIQPILGCKDISYLQADPSNQIRNFIRDLALENNFSFYDIRQHQGFLRNLIIRYATTGELMINLCVGEENKQALDLIFSALLANFPQITTLLYTLNTKLNDSIFDLEPVVVHGKGYIKEVLEDFTFKIGPKSFFQTNSRQGEELYKVTRNYAELTGSEVLYDLYCGTGSIGIFCSKHVKKLVGVEAISEAVSDAHINAELNNVNHAMFFDGDVIDICTDTFFNQHGNPDVVITDPPRAGMHEKLVRKLLEISAPTVVYVSCNPATQARDLQLLDEGYSVEKIQPVDMFPHTHHIENVVQLKRR